MEAPKVDYLIIIFESQSLESWVTHFSNLFPRNNNQRNSGSAINAYRDGFKTNEAYTFILEYSTDNDTRKYQRTVS